MLFTHKDDPSIVYETSDIDIEFCPQGGGFVHRMKLSEFLATAAFYVPPDAAVKAKFSLDYWVPGEYVEGYHFGERWNGWMCPYFSRDQLGRLLDLVQVLRFEDNKVIEPTDYEGEPDIIYDPQIIKTVDGDVEVWPVGNMSWCWDEVKE